MTSTKLHSANMHETAQLLERIEAYSAEIKLSSYNPTISLVRPFVIAGRLPSTMADELCLAGQGGSVVDILDSPRLESLLIHLFGEEGHAQFRKVVTERESIQASLRASISQILDDLGIAFTWTARTLNVSYIAGAEVALEASRRIVSLIETYLGVLGESDD